MSYIPPIGSNIQFSLSVSYIPPIGNNIQFSFADSTFIDFVFNYNDYIAPVNNNIIFWFNQPDITSIPSNILYVESSLSIQYVASLINISIIESNLSSANDIIIPLEINTINTHSSLNYDTNSQAIFVIPANIINTSSNINFGSDAIFNIPPNNLYINSSLIGLFDHHISLEDNQINTLHSLSGSIVINQLHNNLTVNSILEIQADIIYDFIYQIDIGTIHSDLIDIYTLQDKFFIDFIYKNSLLIQSDLNYKFGIDIYNNIAYISDIRGNIILDFLYKNSFLIQSDLNYKFGIDIYNNIDYISDINTTIISEHIFNNNILNIINNNHIYLSTYYLINSNTYNLDLRLQIINNFAYNVFFADVINNTYSYVQGLHLYSNIVYSSNIGMNTINNFIYKHDLTKPIDSVFSDLYDLQINNILISDNNISYYIASDDITLYENEILAYIDNEIIEIVSCDFSIYENNFSYSFNAEIANISDWLKCISGKEIRIYLNNNQYDFIIDNRARNRSFNSDVYTIEGRSKTSILETTEEVITARYDDIMASNIIDNISDHYKINIINLMYDYYIPKDLLAFDKSSPINILQRLVEAGGGLIYATNLGSLIIKQKYPALSKDYKSFVESFNDYDNIYSISESKDILYSWESVIISNITQADENYTYSISEVEDIDTYIKKIRVQVYPFLEKIDLLTSYEDSNIIIKGLENPIQETITETIEIVEGKGSTSNSIKQLLSYRYFNNVLGNIKFNGNDITTNNKGQSLLEITYKTEYHDFILYNGIQTDIIQVYATDKYEVI